MKRILALLLSVSTALGQVNVQKASGTNEISGSLVVGSGKTLTATGSGTIIATGGTATTVPWSGVTGTPTTLAGYGITSPLLPTVGGTGQSTWTLGDFLYANGTNTLAKLAGNTSATLAVLTQTGTGTVSAAPVWTSTTGTGNVVRATSPTLVTPTIDTITAPASTALTLTGGSTGASLVLGQGATAGATLTATGTGNLSLSGPVQINGASNSTSYKFTVKRATNFQLGVGLQNASSAISLEAFNDAVSANVPFAIYGAPLSLMGGNVLVGGFADITGSGGLKVFGTTPSATITSGSLINAGGFGNTGAINSGGNFTALASTGSPFSVSFSGGYTTIASSTASQWVINNGTPSVYWDLSSSAASWNFRSTFNGSNVFTFGGTGNLTAVGNGAFGPSFTPQAWGTGGALDVNGTTGGIVGVAYNGAAKGYVLAEAGGILVNSHAGGTAKFNTGGSGATTVGNTGSVTTINATTANIPGTTSASSSTVGALTIGNGTAATNVAIGGGNVNAGGTLTVGGAIATVTGTTEANLLLNATSSTAGQRVWNIQSASDSFKLRLLGDIFTPVLLTPFEVNGTGVFKINTTTASTGSTSGALQVAGGVYAGAASVFGAGIGLFGATPSSGLFGLSIGAMSGTNQYGITDQTGSHTVTAPATEVMGHRVYSTLALGASGTLTNWYGFNSTLNSKTGAAVLTNAYAFYANSPTQATNNYAFYSAGTAPSVFGGDVRIGSAAAPTYGTAGKLYVYGGPARLNLNGADSTWIKGLTLTPTGDNFRHVHQYAWSNTGNSVATKWVKEINGTETDMMSITDGNLAVLGTGTSTFAGKVSLSAGAPLQIGTLTPYAGTTSYATAAMQGTLGALIDFGKSNAVARVWRMGLGIDGADEFGVQDLTLGGSTVFRLTAGTRGAAFTGAVTAGNGIAAFARTDAAYPGVVNITASPNVTTDLFGYGDGTRHGLIRGNQNGANISDFRFGYWASPTFTESFRVTTSGNGVGNASTAVNIYGTTPSSGVGTGALQVAGGIYAGAASVFGGDITMTRGASGGYFSLLTSGTTAEQAVLFTDSGGASGALAYTHSTDTMVLNAGGATRLSLNSTAATFSGAVSGTTAAFSGAITNAKATSTVASGAVSSMVGTSAVSGILQEWKTNTSTQRAYIGTADQVVVGGVIADFAIDATSGNLKLSTAQNTRVTVSSAGIDVVGGATFTSAVKSTSPSGGIGYGTGAGAAVTQLTSKATTVVSNFITGKITTAADALAKGDAVSFTFTNSRIEANDVVMFSIQSGATAGEYNVFCDSVSAGSCRVSIKHYAGGAGGSLSEALVINYVVIKGVSS